MHLIPPSDQRGTNELNPRPRQVRMFCPSEDCGERGIFSLTWTNESGGRLSWALDRCLDCGQLVTFIVVPDDAETIEDAWDVDVFAYPAPDRLRSGLDGLSDVPAFDESLKKVYRSAIEAYNNKDWGGAAVHTGKVLEGLAKSMLPEDQHDETLYRLLGRLPEHVDLEAPLVDLAHTIRKGRNLAAHFNQEIATDRETARLLLDLLDELLEYLLVTPQHIEELQHRID